MAADDDYYIDVKELNCTREMYEARLSDIERQLAKRFGFTGDVRQQLIELDKANRLVEDELVADWYDELASLKDFERKPVVQCDNSEDYDTEGASSARLQAIEKELAQRLGITGDVRQQLIELDRAGNLNEDNLVANWHQELASYQESFENAGDARVENTPG